MSGSTNHGLMHRIGAQAEDDPQAVAIGRRLWAVRHAAQAFVDAVGGGDDLPERLRPAMVALREALAHPADADE
jgi:hypothetical protein